MEVKIIIMLALLGALLITISIVYYMANKRLNQIIDIFENVNQWIYEYEKYLNYDNAEKEEATEKLLIEFIKIAEDILNG